MLLHCARWLTILLPITFITGPAAAEVGIALIGLLFLAHSARARDWLWVRTPWMVALLLLWAYFCISTLFLPDPSAGGSRLFWFRYPVLFAALSSWILLDVTTQRRTLMSLLAIVTFLSADAIWQYYSGHDVFGRARMDLLNFSRLTGPYDSPHIGITLAWIGFPALGYMCWLVQTRRSRQHVLQIAAALLVGMFVWAVYLSGERMAFLLTGLGLVLSLLLFRGVRPIFIVVVVLLVASVGTLALYKPQLLERQLYQTQQNIEQYQHSVYGRVLVSALAVWRDEPIFGVGIKQFRARCPDAKYGPVVQEGMAPRCVMHPHNTYAELLAESGLVGFLLFVFAMAAIGTQCWWNRARILSDAILAGLVVTFIIRIWPFVAIASPYVPWSAAPFWLLTGFLVARLTTTEARDATH